MTALTAVTFAAMVDHTLLTPTATEADIRSLCKEAREFGTASVCVNPAWVPVAASELAGSPVAVCAVAGFPLGADPAEAVAATVRIAQEEGAVEIDTVIPIGVLIGGGADQVERHLSVVRAAADRAILKVILETAVLSDSQIVTGCRRSVAAGADFVKTSTGFHAAGGATEHAVRLMRDTVGPGLGVKASGGIRIRADVEVMVAAGATRLGMSATAAVVHEFS